MAPPRLNSRNTNSPITQRTTPERLPAQNSEASDLLREASEFSGPRASLASLSQRNPRIPTSLLGPDQILKLRLQETFRSLNESLALADRAVPNNHEAGVINYSNLATSLAQARVAQTRATHLLTQLQARGISARTLATQTEALDSFGMRLQTHETTLSQWQPGPEPIAPRPTTRSLGSQAQHLATSIREYATGLALRLGEWSDATVRGVRHYGGDTVANIYDYSLDATTRSTRAPALLLAPQLLENNFHLLRTTDRLSRPFLWQRLVANSDLAALEARGISIPHQQLASYESFVAHLRSQGIHFPERIHSFQDALILLHNRTHETDLGRDRPIAVVIGARHDESNAFAQSTAIGDLVQSRQFDVVYYEADSPMEMMQQLRRLANHHGRPIHTLTIMGHGTRRGIRLGEHARLRSSSFWRDNNSGRVQSAELNGLDRIIAPNGQVLLISCSTAEHPDATQSPEAFRNVASAITQFLPGRTIHASETVNGLTSLQIGRDHSVSIHGLVDSTIVLRQEPQADQEPAQTSGRDSGILPHWAGNILFSIHDAIS